MERIATRVGRDNGFKELIFSKDEMKYCDAKASPFEHYAARFAAKEAFLKAVGRGWDSGLQWNEIEIINEKNGKPALRITGITEQTLAPMGIRIIHVSLSHLKSMATAIVILES